MPIYEYRCEDCAREFEAFVTTERRAECPGCQGTKLAKRLSSPGMVGVGAGPAKQAMPSGGCGAGGAHCACRAGGH